MPKFTSQEVALAYMQANGAGLNEEEFLVKLIKKEQEFAKLLEIDNLEEHLKNERATIFAKLAR